MDKFKNFLLDFLLVTDGYVCEISGFCRGVVDSFAVLGRYAA
jgi:hypothetical protein